MIKTRAEEIRLIESENTTIVNQSEHSSQVYILGLIPLIGLGISFVVFIVFDNMISHALFKKARGKVPYCKVQDSLEQFMNFIINYLGIRYFGRAKVRQIQVMQPDAAFQYYTTEYFFNEHCLFFLHVKTYSNVYTYSVLKIF